MPDAEHRRLRQIAYLDGPVPGRGFESHPPFLLQVSQPAAACCHRGEMSDEDLEALRRHGFGVAYRMLGSVSEAEDVTQEALLRLTRQEGPIDEPAAWITTVVTRLSINVLRSARARRESYVGPWLPEPLVEDPAPDPASRAELADSLSLAMLVLLERLTPVERAAYLLREVFGYGYAEIADVIEQTEVNSRQLVTRARKHLEANRPRFDPDEAARDALLERFLAAAEEGDLEALEELLAKDAVLYADSGGKATAPQEPLFGAAVIARFMAAVAQARPSDELVSRRVRVNGQPGRLLRGPAERPLGEAERLAAEKALALVTCGDVDADQLAALVKESRDAAGAVPQQQSELRVWSVLTVDVVEGRIQTVRVVRNPDKLAHL
jgi:RNA polymerase sigma-70 factor (ECF subfamily)